MGHLKYACENDLVYVTTCGKIPYFNAPVFFENKEQIGKIDEIFGGITDNVTKIFYTKTKKIKYVIRIYRRSRLNSMIG